MNRCALCPGVHKCLPPDGPQRARILFIGEAPGKTEEQRGRVFVGKTGEEVDGHYLPLAGLRRRDVLFTNAIGCYPTSAGGKLDASRRKDQELLESCATSRLYPLIERLQPEVLVPLGAFACRALGLGDGLGDSQSTPFVGLDAGHGIPTETVWGIPAFPMFHPALGIHEPKRMLHIRNDWMRLGQYLKGTLRLPEDPYGEPDYQEVVDEAELEDLDPTLPLAGDTESRRTGEPFCFTFSQCPGTGRLIRASNVGQLAALNARLQNWEADILFHNWLYDWSVCEKMALHVPYRNLVDTMALAYRLGNLPQGLKALAWRECGMLMQDFDDLVTPYSKANVLHYYRLAQSHEWQRPPEELVIDDKTGLWKLYKPQSMSTKLKRFFTDLSKNEEKDVFGMFEDNWVNEQAAIEEKCGPYPGKCISHVPFQETLHYACRDADALIRLKPILDRMKANVGYLPQERWREYAHHGYPEGRR